MLSKAKATSWIKAIRCCYKIWDLQLMAALMTDREKLYLTSVGYYHVDHGYLFAFDRDENGHMLEVKPDYQMFIPVYNLLCDYHFTESQDVKDATRLKILEECRRLLRMYELRIAA